MPVVLSPETFERIVGVAAPTDGQPAPGGLALPAGTRLVDRRQAQRIQIGERVKIRLAEKKYGGAWDTVMLQDISVQGISFVSSDSITVNDPVELWMKDRQGESVRIRCSVKRCERGGFGGVSYLVGAIFEEMLDSAADQEPQTVTPRRREGEGRQGLAGVFKKLNPAEWFGRSNDDFSTSTTGFKLPEELLKQTEIAEQRASAAKAAATAGFRQDGSSLFAKAAPQPADAEKTPEVDAAKIEEITLAPTQEPTAEPAAQNIPAIQFDFTAEMLPAYLRNPRMVEELIPWLHLRGVADADMAAAATHLGFDGTTLSPPSVGKLRQWWQDEYRTWRFRDLKGKRYIYLWAQTLGDEQSCIISLVGATENGKRELVELRYAEDRSAGSWKSVLLDLVKRGLIKPPKAAVGQAGMSFWSALAEVSKSTRHQFVWDRQLLDEIGGEKLAEILGAATKQEALAAVERLAQANPATSKLSANRDGLLAFFDFPADERGILCQPSPLPAAFEGVRLDGCGTGIDDKMVMLFKLAQFAQKSWEPLPSSTSPTTDKQAA